MTALAAARATKRRDGFNSNYPVGTARTLFAGGMVSLLATGGYACPAGTALSGRCVGVAIETVANAGADGAERVEVERGIFQFANSADADLITHAHIGQPCYIVDDQTVALTDDDGDREIAGAIVDVDTLGVWVDVRPGAVGPQGPQGIPG